MFERVFTPIGITPNDIRWRKNAYRPDVINGIKRREFGAGFSANVQALSRIGYLYLRDGWWNGEQILFHNFIEQVRQPTPQFAKLPTFPGDPHGNAAPHYGLLWWNNADGTLDGLPRDAYWSWGLFDSFICVVPSLDLVIARAGKSWKRAKDAESYAVLKPFFVPIAQAVSAARKTVTLPYPRSSVIKDITWAPASSIVRKAKGSDNWPMTWGDDDALYTAYGDGNGFEPLIKEKLSVGLVKITGDPANFVGVNLRSPTAEAKGDGKRGRKASGMLMVEGVLYQLVRNVDNAQLGWSTDHGATWTWADWKFSKSFGCPSFINFGKNYAGARDNFVYLYSQDADSAYERADRMVMARVSKEKLRDASAYEYFVKLDEKGTSVWSRDVAQRGEIFANAGKCYRSSMSYNVALKRYLWCQTGGGSDTRFAGGFTIYDAPEPWGPWTVAYHAETWDVGPGESMHLPPKWMSADGRTLHLVFSGNDMFSVRQGVLQLSTGP